MAATPKVDPRKDRLTPRATGSLIASYVIWAVVALGAIAAAGSIFVWRDGRAPIAQAPLVTPRPQQIVVNPAADRELKRLNEAVRVLAEERDRLADRLEQLERSVGDITASIPKNKPAPPDVSPAPPTAPAVEVVTPPPPTPQPRPQNVQGPNQIMPRQPVQTPPVAQPEAPPQTPPQVQANRTPTPPADTPNATKTIFAVDLGGDKTVDGLRARWTNISGVFGSAVNGLRPLVSIKEGPKSGTVELRLVVGPLENAAAAARVCARLQIGGVPCVPTVFEGQRLTLR